MVFCSLLVYPLDNIYRYAAERCLGKLLAQLDESDVLLTYERNCLLSRNEAWRLKPKVVAMSLAIAEKNEWVAYVDADIDFKGDFVKRLKEFLAAVENDGKPTIVATKIWERGGDNWIDESIIIDYYNRSQLGVRMWDFYFGTGLFIVNKAFLQFVDEWQILTNLSQHFPEETALVALVHRHLDKIRLVWLPDEIHFVGWKLRQVKEDASAIHIGSDNIDMWLKAAKEG